MMKKFVSMVLVLLLVLSLCTTAFAGSVIGSGTSSGGTLGKTSCTAELHYYNSSAAGADYAYAETGSTNSGKLGAMATIYYNGTKTSKAAVREGATEVRTAKAYAGDSYQATKAVGSHTYSSKEYGSWSRSLTYTF